jgi:hypothetical protein
MERTGRSASGMESEWLRRGVGPGHDLFDVCLYEILIDRSLAIKSCTCILVPGYNELSTQYF